MSQLPSDPGTSDNRRRPVTYDELIAMFVAFLTLGSVLFWGLTRSGVNLFGTTGELFNVNGATPSVEGLDNGNRPDILDDRPDAIAGEAEDTRIGFGTGDSIGATDADRAFEDISQAAEQAAAEIASPRNLVTSQAATTPPVTAPAETPAPVPPQQAAQPADPEVITATPTNQPPLEVSREAVEFQDVPDDYWAKPYIDALSERLVVDGLADGTFAPDEPVTRAQLASAIARAFPLSDEEAAIAFSDIEADYWATDDIDEAVKGGFMTGFPDERFQPDLAVPRAQVLTALVTGLDSIIPENPEAVVARYGDAAQIPGWAIGKMAAATESNIVVNYPNLESLNPNQPATRAEVAAMIYQTLAAQGRVDGIDGEYAVEP
ncbi:MAG: S-layer homology domain-containing protein [Cyanobacteria bacterium P01_H01_bin.21]